MVPFVEIGWGPSVKSTNIGTACDRYHNEHVRDLKSQRVQADEVWSFVYAKSKNVPKEKQAFGVGDVWTWTALDADSKLLISYLVGKRDAGYAFEFLQDVASYLSNRSPAHHRRP